MVHSLYQSLNNLETIYADRIGIRYFFCDITHVLQELTVTGNIRNL